ncbi:MAG TPA: hypothetical protein VF093_10350 [Solirubrobacterales bacterium]
MFAHDSQVVHRTRSPLVALERHRLELDPGVLSTARHELLAGEEAGTDFRLGFLLGVEAEAGRHPACLRLSRKLQEQTLCPLEEADGISFGLSFLKLAIGDPPAEREGPLYEGPHLDSHPGLTESVELLRLLLNLSVHPRRFLFATNDRWGLEAAGVPYGRREFAPLALPAGSETRVVGIPGRTETSVYGLKFLASVVPHVGLNDPPEHFLASFESLVDLGTTE